MIAAANIASSTTTVILAAPSSGDGFAVTGIIVYNGDANILTATLQLKNSGNAYVLGKRTIAQDDTWIFSDMEKILLQEGWSLELITAGTSVTASVAASYMPGVV